MLERRMLTITLQQSQAVWEEAKRPEHECSSCPSYCHSFGLLLLLVHPSQMKPVPYTVHKKHLYIILLFETGGTNRGREEETRGEYEEIQERSKREAEGNMRECGQDAGGGGDEVGGKKKKYA